MSKDSKQRNNVLGYHGVNFIAIGLLHVVSEHNDHNSLQHDDLGQGHRNIVKYRWYRFRESSYFTDSSFQDTCYINS